MEHSDVSAQMQTDLSELGGSLGKEACESHLGIKAAIRRSAVRTAKPQAEWCHRRSPVYD